MHFLDVVDQLAGPHIEHLHFEYPTKPAALLKLGVWNDRGTGLLATEEVSHVIRK
jgi:hypothetical protein